MGDLLIFGAGDLARLACYYFKTSVHRMPSALVVDAAYCTESSRWGIPMLSWDEVCERYPARDADMFVAVGYKSMRSRAEAYNRVEKEGFRRLNLISSQSYIAEGVSIGQNNFIMPGAVIEPGVTIGNNNIIWSNATVCHDVRMGHHNFLAANVTLGGYVALGERNFIGFSATVLQQLTVGDDTLIGAGALIRKNTRNLRQYTGVPAIESAEIDTKIGIEVS